MCARVCWAFTEFVGKLFDTFLPSVRPQRWACRCRDPVWSVASPRPLCACLWRHWCLDTSSPVWGTYSTLGWCMCCSPILPLKPRPSPACQCFLTGPATMMTASPRHSGAARQPTVTCCQKEHSAACASPLLLRQTSEPADDQAAFVCLTQQLVLKVFVRGSPYRPKVNVYGKVALQFLCSSSP